MIDLMSLMQYSIALIGSIFVGGYLHELSHYFVGWLGNTDPKLHWTPLLVPNGVDHGEIETMSPTIIRLSGISVLVWIPPAILSQFYLVADFSPMQLFQSLTPLMVVIMTSNSDIAAVRDPELFREKWMNEEFDREMAFLPDKIQP